MNSGIFYLAGSSSFVRDLLAETTDHQIEAHETDQYDDSLQLNIIVRESLPTTPAQSRLYRLMSTALMLKHCPKFPTKIIQDGIMTLVTHGTPMLSTCILMNDLHALKQFTECRMKLTTLKAALHQYDFNGTTHELMCVDGYYILDGDKLYDNLYHWLIKKHGIKAVYRYLVSTDVIPKDRIDVHNTILSGLDPCLFSDFRINVADYKMALSCHRIILNIVPFFACYFRKNPNSLDISITAYVDDVKTAIAFIYGNIPITPDTSIGTLELLVSWYDGDPLKESIELLLEYKV